ncbi:MAG: Hint domain-containing protein [Pseudomonadota bacterium]
MATFFFTVRGDQIGTFSSISGTGNGAERLVTLAGVTPIGSSDELFTIQIDQAQDTETQFRNGQLLTILDADGNVVAARTSVQPDIEQGLGAGDEHLIIQQGSVVINLRGVVDPDNPGTLVFENGSQVADPLLGDNDGELDFVDTVSNFPCFSAGTLIATLGGDLPVESLRPGTMVLTRDQGPQPVLWIGGRTLHFPGALPSQKPLAFKAGSLGPNQPARDLIVSPQHRILRPDPSRSGEVLVPAKALLGLRGVRVMKGKRSVTYVSVLMARHQILAANGAWVESFYPGPVAMDLITPQHRREIANLIPGLQADVIEAYGPPARPLLRVGEAKRARITQSRKLDPV